MKSIYASFETNNETDGIWHDTGAGSFLLARAGGSNQKFINRYQHLMKPYQKRRGRNVTPAEDKANEIMIDCMVTAVILDWKDVYGRDGKLIKYSEKSCKTLLEDLPELRMLLLEVAMEADSFLVEDANELAEEAGNS